MLLALFASCFFVSGVFEKIAKSRYRLDPGLRRGNEGRGVRLGGEVGSFAGVTQ